MPLDSLSIETHSARSFSAADTSSVAGNVKATMSYATMSSEFIRDTTQEANRLGQCCIKPLPKKISARALVVGKGRFGSGLFQGVSSASARGYAGVEVDHMSAKAFCTLSAHSMAEMLKPYKFLMYAGYNLRAQVAKLSEAMPLASPDATLEILDFTNPEPGAWDGDDVGAAYGLKMTLDARDPAAERFGVRRIASTSRHDRRDARDVRNGTRVATHGQGLATAGHPAAGIVTQGVPSVRGRRGRAERGRVELVGGRGTKFGGGCSRRGDGGEGVRTSSGAGVRNGERRRLDGLRGASG